MTNEGFSRFGLYLLDRLTDRFPGSVPRMFQRVFLTVVGSRLVTFAVLRYHQRRLRSIQSFDSLLVIADVGIGDALIVQRSVTALRSLFPTSRIDYVCSNTAGELLLSLPAADHVYPIFDKEGAPSEKSYGEIRQLIHSASYGAILNLSPFLDGALVARDIPVLDLFVPLASYIVRLWRLPGKRRHISLAVVHFLRAFFGADSRRRALLPDESERGEARSVKFVGNELYIPDEHIEAADAFLASKGLGSADGLVFHNPDATTAYSLIPFDFQVRLLSQLAEDETISSILLGEAYSQKGIEQRLLEALPGRLQRRLVIVPHIPLPQYAAILDACDAFVSGDGGPTHIAASWKHSRSGGRTMRNHTAVFTVFGGTDSRMYGYDSLRRDHVAASQRAPSRVFVAPAECRNITCVDKLGKTCREVRCFSGLRAEWVARAVTEYLTSTSRMRHSA